MKYVPIRTSLLLVACSFLIAGCASIFEKETQEIEIVTEPAECSITITNNEGKKLFEGKTPFKAELDKANGYFKGHTYDVHIEKGGFRTQDIIIKSKNNAWYVFGNTFNAFVPGWIGIDPKTHAMYEFTPAKLEIRLVPDTDQ